MDFMKNKPVLVVDDEKNIRRTLSLTIEPMGFEVRAVGSGEEALAALNEQDFGLLLLDLRMPGMDGMEVLRQVRALRPDIRVVIITAHGSIDSAVEAMKLGAVDFLQKPFDPQEIRDLVQRLLDREELDGERVQDYASALELAKRNIGKLHFDAALEHLRKAVFLDHSRPEAFNLMGAILELRKDLDEARKHYRAALSLDPTYEPARKNLDRATSFHRTGQIDLGESTGDPHGLPPK
jgi:FixJ family two-component response regulator